MNMKIALYVKNNEITCLDSFGVEHIFLRRLKYLLVIKTYKKTYSEYKQTIQ